jgi:hypothetical protein
MNGKFVTTYIDGTTGNPAYLDGGEFNALTPPIDPGAYIAIPGESQGIAVAAVFLLSGTSRIGWGEIYDLRHPHVPVPPTGVVFEDSNPTFQNTVLFAGDIGVGGDVHVTGSVYSGDGSFYTAGWLQTVDRADPSTPPANQGRYYSKSGKPYFKTFDGTVYDLSVTGSAGGVSDHGALTGLGDDDHTQYLLEDGTRALSADWDAGGFRIQARQFYADVPNGTPPLIVASSTLIANLNADRLDGLHASVFLIGNIVTKTGDYTATATDFTIICDATSGAITITLPDADSSYRKIYHIKKVDGTGNTVTIDADGAEMIDDAATVVITAQYESVTIQCDGTEWWVI